MSNGRFLIRSLPNPNAATMDAADRGEKTAKYWTEFSGYYEPVPDGRIYPADFRRTKLATDVSKCGLKTAL